MYAGMIPARSGSQEGCEKVYRPVNVIFLTKRIRMDFMVRSPSVQDMLRSPTTFSSVGSVYELVCRHGK